VFFCQRSARGSLLPSRKGGAVAPPTLSSTSSAHSGTSSSSRSDRFVIPRVVLPFLFFGIIHLRPLPLPALWSSRFRWPEQNVPGPETHKSQSWYQASTKAMQRVASAASHPPSAALYATCCHTTDAPVDGQSKTGSSIICILICVLHQIAARWPLLH
jgi:hypothetical protein